MDDNFVLIISFINETDALIKLDSVQSIAKMVVVTMEEESCVEKMDTI